MSRSSTTQSDASRVSVPRRRWGFRILAGCLPFALFGIVELILRLNGVYLPTRFWLRTAAPGELTPNTHFADRFVGRTQARMPRSTRVQEHPARGSLRVVVFGESAALGDPEPDFGVSRCLEALLEHRFPDRRIEILNTAVTALNSYAIREAARDSQRLGADFWVIYAGNNEVIGPFGPSSIASGSPPSLLKARLGLRLRSTALGQWLTAREGLMSDGLSMTQRWAGLELFADRQVAMDDSRLPVMRENFGANLRDIVNLGVRSRSKVLLSTMAVNLVDCAPFYSPGMHLTNDSRHAEWFAAAAAARAEDDRGAAAEAIAAWQKAAALWPDDAETRFRLGVARLNEGDFATARADLERARDLDTVRLRADSGINQIVRTVAGEHDPASVRMVDADRELRGTDPQRPPGMDLFFEHVHLRPEGNYRLARMFAETISAWLGNPARSANWLEMQPCLERLGWNPFAEARLWSQTRALCERPPFSHQSNAELRNRFLDDRIVEANRSARPAALGHHIARIQSIVQTHPNDWQLREQLARLLQTGRRWAEAGAEWQRIVQLAPGHVVGWYQLAESLSGAGDKPGAQHAYERALEIRPDFVEATIGLGFVLGEQKNFRAALAALDRALRYSPRNLQARVNRGVTLIALDRIEEAVADLKQAAAEHPESAMPAVRLGELLANGKSHEAAAAAYAEAARRETNNAALRHRLALELSLSGRTNEAEQEFRLALQQVPNSPLLHMDYGVALARQARYEEARAEFEEALKRQPSNSQVQAYLEQVRAHLGERKGR